MALLLTEQDVQELASMAPAIEALENAHLQQGVGNAANEARRRLRAPHGAVAVMFGGDAETGFLGFKTAFYAGGKAHVLLYDVNARSLAAIVQAGWLGTLRTGAASGVATKHMARPDASSVGVIGTGRQARTQVEAMVAVRPEIKLVKAYGRDEGRRTEFARRMTAQLGVSVEPVSEPSMVAAEDIVITATNSVAPVLNGDWLQPGAHVNAIGSNSLLRREIDLEVVRRAGLIVVDDRQQTALEGGDLQEACERGIVDLARMPELADIVVRPPMRKSADEITLFESHGIGLWDVALATVVYRAAKAQGRGAEVDI